LLTKSPFSVKKLNRDRLRLLAGLPGMQEQVQTFLVSRLRLLDESGFSPVAEATFLFQTHKGASMPGMPSIESDFPVLGGVHFNLLYCYEIPW